jgi:hypothetical protein
VNALALVTVLWGALLLAAATFSVACHFGRRPRRDPPTLTGLDAALEGLAGWPLVEAAQRAVHTAMPEYGFCNGFDPPLLALERGRGASWQRALVLRALLRRRGIEARPVCAFLTRFAGGRIAGHTWLEVRVEGEVRRVCADRFDNQPGRVEFEPITRVSSLGPLMLGLTWLAAPIAKLAAALVHVARGGRLRASADEVVPWSERFTRCAFVWLVPILGWNALLTPHLAVRFTDDRGVPGWLLVAEHVARAFVFGAPLLLQASLTRTWQRRGLWLYFAGAAAYLASWLPLLREAAPSAWDVLPFALPAVWLTGLALLARSGAYAAGALVFVVVHVTHGVLLMSLP